MKHKYDSGNSVAQDTHDESCEYVEECIHCGDLTTGMVCKACTRKALRIESGVRSQEQ